MTTVGKILVFLIAVFSVLFLSFAVPVYATRVNWMDKYRGSEAELKKANAQIAALNQRVNFCPPTCGRRSRITKRNRRRT